VLSIQRLAGRWPSASPIRAKSSLCENARCPRPRNPRLMRRALVVTTLALALVLVPAAHAASVGIFYYAWYGTPAFDGSYEQWNMNGHAPPLDIASSFYPAGGIYSSRNPRVMARQMRDMKKAGADTVIYSWWGRGSEQDLLLPQAIAAAGRAHLKVAIHLEPYLDRGAISIEADVVYLWNLGIKDFYVYEPKLIDACAWISMRLRVPRGARFFAATPLVGWTLQAGFDGLYNYDVFAFGPSLFRRVCQQAHAKDLICIPSVGPGYDSTGVFGGDQVKPRRNGSTYDSMWTAAIKSQPDGITITSYNEWLEGTQIEPARIQHGYKSYDRAWGLRGHPARRAYICRSAQWSALFRKISANASLPVRISRTVPRC
jgi:glycoprotein endo-alpha-1,2-mannosidase